MTQKQVPSISGTTTSIEVSRELGMTELKVKRLVRQHGIRYFTKSGYYVLPATALEELVEAMLRPLDQKKIFAKKQARETEASKNRNEGVTRRAKARETKKVPPQTQNKAAG